MADDLVILGKLTGKILGKGIRPGKSGDTAGLLIRVF
jgi:hypothetical protein